MGRPEGSFADFVAGDVGGAGELHTMLRDKALEQVVHTAHHLAVAVNFVRAVFLNRPNADFFDVTRDDTGEGAA